MEDCSFLRLSTGMVLGPQDVILTTYSLVEEIQFHIHSLGKSYSFKLYLLESSGN